MTNSELAKQAYAFEQVVREAFEKCHAALIGSPYDFDKYELTNDGVEITGYDYHCGGDYESFTIPYADLDDVDAFLVRRQAEIAEAARQKEAQKLADDAKKRMAVEQTERQQYLKLKEKYEGVTK
jgi:hypothetical protein